jgi:hypothetical protein
VRMLWGCVMVMPCLRHANSCMAIRGCVRGEADDRVITRARVSIACTTCAFAMKLWYSLEEARLSEWGCGACALTCSSLTLTHSLTRVQSRCAFLMQPVTSLPTHPPSHSLTLRFLRPLDWTANAAVRWCMSRRDGDWFFEKEILWPGQVRSQSHASPHVLELQPPPHAATSAPTFQLCKHVHHHHMQLLQPPRSS